MPKSVAYGLLEPVLRQTAAPHIVCREGKLASLLGDLAVHRLDIVFADRPMPANLAVRGYSHLLGECGITFLATPALARRHPGRFPGNLDGAPLLLPGEDSDVRRRLLRWFDTSGVRPQDRRRVRRQCAADGIRARRRRHLSGADRDRCAGAPAGRRRGHRQHAWR